MMPRQYGKAFLNNALFASRARVNAEFRRCSLRPQLCRAARRSGVGGWQALRFTPTRDKTSPRKGDALGKPGGTPSPPRRRARQRCRWRAPERMLVRWPYIAWRLWRLAPRDAIRPVSRHAPVGTGAMRGQREAMARRPALRARLSPPGGAYGRRSVGYGIGARKRWLFIRNDIPASSPLCR